MMSLEIEEEFRKKVREYLFPSTSKNALTRQVFELVHYGHFSYESVMSMPISKRRRMYYLLVKYSERDQAIAKSLPPPPIDSSDIDVNLLNTNTSESQEKIDDLIEKFRRKEKGNLKTKPPTDDVPPVLKEALDKLKQDGLISQSGELLPVEDAPKFNKKVIPVPKKKIEIPDELQKLFSNIQKVE